jgi:putative Mg2+ transporter-C (MgtC) family protein
VWNTILQTLRDEFSDLADPAQFTRVVVRIALAVSLGACLGFERERHGSTAGLRTHMLVALGVALLVVSAQQSGMGHTELSRVLQGIFAGIGFLGAGAIIKHSEREHVKGLTTAASIWATAAIATAAGLGREATAILATLFAVVILALLLRLERRMTRESPGGPRDA